MSPLPCRHQRNAEKKQDFDSYLEIPILQFLGGILILCELCLLHCKISSFRVVISPEISNFKLHSLLGEGQAYLAQGNTQPRYPTWHCFYRKRQKAENNSNTKTNVKLPVHAIILLGGDIRDKQIIIENRGSAIQKPNKLIVHKMRTIMHRMCRQSAKSL